MRHIAKAHFAILGAAVTGLIVTLTACGGGGTSSGAGAGGSAVASVSGTVNGGFASTLERHPGVGPAYLIAALGDMMIPMAYAAGLPGVNVVVTCPGVPPYAGVTDAQGRFTIPTPQVTAPTNCSTTFDDITGPEVTVAPGMETEIEVTLSGNTVSLVGVQQRANDSTRLEIEVDDGSNNVAGRSDDDDSSSDDSSSDDVVSNDDDDSRSTDKISNNVDQDSNDPGTS